MIHSKGISFEPKGSLLHHNYIVNSSIIINIIVNGRNRTHDFLMMDSSMEDDDDSLFLIEPGFGIPDDASDNNLDPQIIPNGEPRDDFMPYMKPSNGRVQILDRYNRPMIQIPPAPETTTEDPDE